METQRLTNSLIIAFVLLMHILLFWAVFYQQPVRIDAGMQSLNFVDLGSNIQSDHVPDSSVKTKTVAPTEKVIPAPKPKLEKPHRQPTIKAVETRKPIENHFKVVKKSDAPKQEKQTPTEIKTETTQSKPEPKESSHADANQSNQGATVANAGGEHAQNKGNPNNGSDLVVPNEYQGGFLAKLRPAYPAFSKENGEEGVVGISVSVAADGTPISVIVSESSGYSRLDRSAKQAVQNYRFKPATRGGIAIPYKYHFNVKFSLSR
ncbi:energy transducer TonB [Neisseriaceae bacterium ESL0693]|nr:energy transducer TonB [Neisseriaceae bacterium ESL0693]